MLIRDTFFLDWPRIPHILTPVCLPRLGDLVLGYSVLIKPLLFSHFPPNSMNSQKHQYFHFLEWESNSQPVVCDFVFSWWVPELNNVFDFCRPLFNKYNICHIKSDTYYIRYVYIHRLSSYWNKKLTKLSLLNILNFKMSFHT